MPAPVALLVNPSAGGGRALRVAGDVEDALRGLGMSVRRQDTRDIEHARSLAVGAAQAGETLAVLSGDGTVGAVADAVRDVPGALLGVLPGGRGNDLARVLGIPRDPRAACTTIANGVRRPLDLGLVCAGDGANVHSEDRAYVGIASAGFDSDANRIANEAPSWLGGLVYAYAAVRALLAWKPARFDVVLDAGGEVHSFRAYSVGCANSRAYGGGMRAAPQAMLDDGLLDVVVLEDVSKREFVTKLLPRVFKGTHVELPCVHVFRAAEVAVSADRPFTVYADGDPIGELPLRVRALRGAIDVLVPANAGENSPFVSDPRG